MNLSDLQTPALILDSLIMDANLERMRAQVRRLGASLRPHVKTAKSIDVVRRALAGESGRITVSTLREADYFFEQGIRDILYAVGIAPGKLGEVVTLIRRGADLAVVVDNATAARAVAAAAAAEHVTIPVFIELDVDGHRAGVEPSDPLLLELGGILASTSNVELRGVMTHAGESYNCRSQQAIREMAERERGGAVHAAMRLREQGIPAPIVSVGSTPTAVFAADLSGVTEVRAGVYMFHDLVMAGLGVCTIEQIALSVLVTVIGHQHKRGWIITDGGWMALSRDRGTAAQAVDQGYGVVRGARGDALTDDLIVVAANQEHGILAGRNAGALDLERYPVGTLLRVLPNHACATAAQHSSYRVVSGECDEIFATWPRIGGW